MGLKIPVVFSDLLAQGAQGLGVILVHLLLPFLIFPQLIKVVLQVSQDSDIEPGDTFLVHNALRFPICFSQELKLFQALGDIPNLHGITDGPDKVGQFLKPLILGASDNSLGIFFIFTQQQRLFAVVTPNRFGDKLLPGQGRLGLAVRTGGKKPRHGDGAEQLRRTRLDPD